MPVLPIESDATYNAVNNTSALYSNVKPTYSRNTYGRSTNNPDEVATLTDYSLEQEGRLDDGLYKGMTREQQMENRGENQSGWEQMLRGITGRTLSIVPKILSSVGYVGGTIKAIFGGEWKDIWDNDFVKATDKMDKDLREGDFKVYGNHKYNSDSFWDKISTSKFWFEDGWDGAMYAGASIFQGLGISKLGQGIKGLIEATKIGKGIAATNEWLQAGKGLAKALPNSVNNMSIIGYNTIAEAGAEGRSAMEDISQKVALKTYGKEFNELSESEKEYCKQKAAPYAKDVFLANAVGLLIPNAIQTNAFFGHSGLFVRTLADKVANKELTDLTLRKAGGIFAKNWASEDFEERIQNAHQRIAREHYDNNDRNTGLEGQSLDHMEALSSFMSNFFTTEDRIAGFLGGMMGGLGSFKEMSGHRKEYKQGLQELKIRKCLNKYAQDMFIPNMNKLFMKDKDGKLIERQGVPEEDLETIRNIYAQHRNGIKLTNAFAESLASGDSAMAEEVKNLTLGTMAYAYFANGYYGNIDDAHKDLLQDYENKIKDVDAPEKLLYDKEYRTKFEQFKQYYKETKDNIDNIEKLEFNSKYYKNQQEAKDMLARDLFAQKVRQSSINNALKALNESNEYTADEKEKISKILKGELEDINIKLDKFSTDKTERAKVLNEYYNKEMTPYVEYESLQKEHDDLLVELQDELSPEEKEHIRKYNDSVSKEESEGGYSNLFTEYNDFVKRKNDGEQIDDTKFQEVKDKLKAFGDINTKKNEILEAHKNFEKIALKRDILEQRLKEQRLIHGIDHRIYEDRKTGLYHEYPFYTPNVIKSNIENIDREKGEYEKFHHESMLDFVHNANIKKMMKNYDDSLNATSIDDILTTYSKKRTFTDQDLEDINNLKDNVDERIKNKHDELDNNGILDEYVTTDEGFSDNTPIGENNEYYVKNEYNNKEGVELAKKALQDQINKHKTLELDKAKNDEIYNKLINSKDDNIIQNRRQLNSDYSTYEGAMKRMLFDIANISTNKARILINDWSQYLDPNKKNLTADEKLNLPPITEKNKEDIDEAIQELEKDIRTYKERLKNPDDNITKLNKDDFDNTDYFKKAEIYLKQLTNIGNNIKKAGDSRQSKQLAALKLYLESANNTIQLLNNEELLSDTTKQLIKEYKDEDNGDIKLIKLYKIYEQLQKEDIKLDTLITSKFDKLNTLIPEGNQTKDKEEEFKLYKGSPSRATFFLRMLDQNFGLLQHTLEIEEKNVKLNPFFKYKNDNNIASLKQAIEELLGNNKDVESLGIILKNTNRLDALTKLYNIIQEHEYINNLYKLKQLIESDFKYSKLIEQYTKLIDNKRLKLYPLFEQRLAIEEASILLNQKHSNNISLKGVAGVGKTTLFAKTTIDVNGYTNEQILCVAKTEKQTNKLATETEQSNKSIIDNILNIPEENAKKLKFVVIDESGHLTNNDWKILNTFKDKYSNVNLMFMGDPTQVADSNSNVITLDEVPRDNYIPTDNIRASLIEIQPLVEVMRTAISSITNLGEQYHNESKEITTLRNVYSSTGQRISNDTLGAQTQDSETNVFNNFIDRYKSGDRGTYLVVNTENRQAYIDALKARQLENMDEYVLTPQSIAGDTVKNVYIILKPTKDNTNVRGFTKDYTKYNAEVYTAITRAENYVQLYTPNIVPKNMLESKGTSESQKKTDDKFKEQNEKKFKKYINDSNKILNDIITKEDKEDDTKIKSFDIIRTTGKFEGSPLSHRSYIIKLDKDELENGELDNINNDVSNSKYYPKQNITTSSNSENIPYPESDNLKYNKSTNKSNILPNTKAYYVPVKYISNNQVKTSIWVVAKSNNKEGYSLLGLLEDTHPLFNKIKDSENNVLINNSNKEIISTPQDRPLELKDFEDKVLQTGIVEEANYLNYDYSDNPIDTTNKSLFDHLLDAMSTLHDGNKDNGKIESFKVIIPSDKEKSEIYNSLGDSLIPGMPYILFNYRYNTGRSKQFLIRLNPRMLNNNDFTINGMFNELGILYKQVKTLEDKLITLGLNDNEWKLGGNTFDSIFRQFKDEFESDGTKAENPLHDNIKHIDKSPEVEEKIRKRLQWLVDNDYIKEIPSNDIVNEVILNFRELAKVIYPKYATISTDIVTVKDPLEFAKAVSKSTNISVDEILDKTGYNINDTNKGKLVKYIIDNITELDFNEGEIPNVKITALKDKLNTLTKEDKSINLKGQEEFISSLIIVISKQLEESKQSNDDSNYNNIGVIEKKLIDYIGIDKYTKICNNLFNNNTNNLTNIFVKGRLNDAVRYGLIRNITNKIFKGTEVTLDIPIQDSTITKTYKLKDNGTIEVNYEDGSKSEILSNKTIHDGEGVIQNQADSVAVTNLFVNNKALKMVNVIKKGNKTKDVAGAKHIFTSTSTYTTYINFLRDTIIDNDLLTNEEEQQLRIQILQDLSNYKDGNLKPIEERLSPEMVASKLEEFLLEGINNIEGITKNQVKTIWDKIMSYKSKKVVNPITSDVLGSIINDNNTMIPLDKGKLDSYFNNESVKTTDNGITVSIDKNDGFTKQVERMINENFTTNTVKINPSKVSINLDNNIKTSSEDINEDKTVPPIISALWLLEDGVGAIKSPGYFLNAISGVFVKSTKAIQNIKTKYAKELTISNLGSFVKTDIYKQIMFEIQEELNKTYSNDPNIQEVFNMILKYPTGMPKKVGEAMKLKLGGVFVDEDIQDTNTTKKQNKRKRADLDDELKENEKTNIGYFETTPNITRWLQKIMPDITLDKNLSENEARVIHKSILDQLKTGDSLLGLVRNGTIYVRQYEVQGKKGTYSGIIRHEAFHKIWNQYLTNKEKKLVEEAYIKEHGTSPKNWKEFSHTLAIDFQTWENTPGKIKESWLKKLFNWIKNLIGISNKHFDTIDKFFRTIEQGQFKKRLLTNDEVMFTDELANIQEIFGDKTSDDTKINSGLSTYNKLLKWIQTEYNALNNEGIEYQEEIIDKDGNTIKEATYYPVNDKKLFEEHVYESIVDEINVLKSKKNKLSNKGITDPKLEESIKTFERLTTVHTIKNKGKDEQILGYKYLLKLTFPSGEIYDIPNITDEELNEDNPNKVNIDESDTETVKSSGITDETLDHSKVDSSNGVSKKIKQLLSTIPTDYKKTSFIPFGAAYKSLLRILPNLDMSGNIIGQLDYYFKNNLGDIKEFNGLKSFIKTLYEQGRTEVYQKGNNYISLRSDIRFIENDTFVFTKDGSSIPIDYTKTPIKLNLKNAVIVERGNLTDKQYWNLIHKTLKDNNVNVDNENIFNHYKRYIAQDNFNSIQSTIGSYYTLNPAVLEIKAGKSGKIHFDYKTSISEGSSKELLNTIQESFLNTLNNEDKTINTKKVGNLIKIFNVPNENSITTFKNMMSYLGLDNMLYKDKDKTQPIVLNEKRTTEAIDTFKKQLLKEISGIPTLISLEKGTNIENQDYDNEDENSTPEIKVTTQALITNKQNFMVFKRIAEVLDNTLLSKTSSTTGVDGQRKYTNIPSSWCRDMVKKMIAYRTKFNELFASKLINKPEYWNTGVYKHNPIISDTTNVKSTLYDSFDHDGIKSKKDFSIYPKEYVDEKTDDHLSRIFNGGFLDFIDKGLRIEPTYIQNWYTQAHRSNPTAGEISMIKQKDLDKYIGNILDMMVTRYKDENNLDNNSPVYNRTSDTNFKVFSKVVKTLYGINNLKLSTDNKVKDLFENKLTNKDERVKITNEIKKEFKNNTERLVKLMINKGMFLDANISKNRLLESKNSDYIYKGIFGDTFDVKNLTTPVTKYNSELGVNETTRYYTESRTLNDVTKKYEHNTTVLNTNEFKTLAYTFYVNNYINSYLLQQVTALDHNFYKDEITMVKRLQAETSPGTKTVSDNNYGTKKTMKVAIGDDIIVTNKDIHKDIDDMFNDVLTDDNVSQKDKDNLIDNIIPTIKYNLVGKIKVTDGQTFVLPETYEQYKKGVGENYRLAHIMKTIQFSGDKLGIPRDIKSSIIVLSDDICNTNPQLDNLRKEMRRIGADVYTFVSTVKIPGTKLKADTQSIYDGKQVLTSEHLVDYDSEGIRIAFNPKHDVVGTVAAPSQEFSFTNVLHNMLDGEQHPFGDNVKEADNIFKALANLMDMKLEQVKKDILDNNGNIDPVKFKTKMLSVIGTDDLNAKINDLVNNLDTNQLLDVPFLTDKLISNIASIIEKSAIQIRLNGSKLILSTPSGTTVMDKATSDIARELKTTYKYDKNTNHYVLNSECIIPRGILPLYIEKQIEEAIEKGEDIPDLLPYSDLFGFRVPSSELHSGIALKVKGFYDSIGTNVIIVAKEIILIHGCDFDVDSLFIIARESETAYNGTAKKGMTQLLKEKKSIIRDLLSEDEKEKLNNIKLSEKTDDEYSFTIDTKLKRVEKIVEDNKDILKEKQDEIKDIDKKINDYRDINLKEGNIKSIPFGYKKVKDGDEMYFDDKLETDPNSNWKSYTDKQKETYYKNKILENLLKVITSEKNLTRMLREVSTDSFKDSRSNIIKYMYPEYAKDLLRENPNISKNDYEELMLSKVNGIIDLSDAVSNEQMKMAVHSGRMAVGIIVAGGIKGLAYMIRAGKLGTRPRVQLDDNGNPRIQLKLGGDIYSQLQQFELKKDYNQDLIENHDKDVWITIDALANLALDNVKLMILPNFYLTNDTLQGYIAMLGLGVRGELRDTLVTQPIMKAFTESKQLTKESKFDTLINSIKIKLGDKINIDTEVTLENNLKYLNREIYEKDGENSLDDYKGADKYEFLNYQLAVLNQFKNATQIGEGISDMSKLLGILRELKTRIEDVDALVELKSEIFNEDGTTNKDFIFDVDNMLNSLPHFKSALKVLDTLKNIVDKNTIKNSKEVRDVIDNIFNKDINPDAPITAKLHNNKNINKAEQRNEYMRWLLSSIYDYEGNNDHWIKNFIGKIQVLKKFISKKEGDKYVRFDDLKKKGYNHTFLNSIYIKNNEYTKNDELTFTKVSDMNPVEITNLEVAFETLNMFDIKQTDKGWEVTDISNDKQRNEYSNFQIDFLKYANLMYGLKIGGNNFSLALPTSLLNYDYKDSNDNESLSYIKRCEKLWNNIRNGNIELKDLNDNFINDFIKVKYTSIPNINTKPSGGTGTIEVNGEKVKYDISFTQEGSFQYQNYIRVNTFDKATQKPVYKIYKKVGETNVKENVNLIHYKLEAQNSTQGVYNLTNEILDKAIDINNNKLIEKNGVYMTNEQARILVNMENNDQVKC